MRAIALTTMLYALVDDEDYEDISALSWYYHHTGYAVRKYRRIDGTQGMELMHRRILGLEEGNPLEGDHKNRITLDNRRSNLRAVTSSVNNENRSLGRKSSQAIGVSRQRNKWRAYIKIDGKQKHLGLFETQQEAKVAYEAAAAEKAMTSSGK